MTEINTILLQVSYDGDQYEPVPVALEISYDDTERRSITIPYVAFVQALQSGRWM